MMEEKVTTPPRGGRPAPVTRVPPRKGGPDRHKDVGSPVDRLVDTVARMQVDLADLPAKVGSGSARGLTPTVADGRRSPGSHTGSAPRREVVTASGDRDTNLTVAGRQSSGVGRIRADVVVVPLWTAADEADP